MIAVDTNLLVYALREDSPFHGQAKSVLVALAESGKRWGIPWPCVHEYISISTHPKIYSPPTPLHLVLKAMEVWMRSPMCEWLREGPGYWEKLKGLAQKGNVRGGMIHDARIAAICLNHAVTELWTCDRDFSRFAGLKVRNPLV